jgi:hypothetical protein
LDYINAEVTAFPKGHVAIATSWSHPGSAYALHQRYEKEQTVGPVRFQLDLQEAMGKPVKTRVSKVTAKKAGKGKAAAKAEGPAKAKSSTAAGVSKKTKGAPKATKTLKTKPEKK